MKISYLSISMLMFFIFGSDISIKVSRYKSFVFTIMSILLTYQICSANTPQIDSLNNLLLSETNAEKRIILSMKSYGEKNYYKSIRENEIALELALESNSAFAQGKIYNSIASAYFLNFEYVNSLKNYQKSLVHAFASQDTIAACTILGNIGMVHSRMENKEKAKEYFDKLEILAQQQNSFANLYTSNWRKGLLYNQYNNHDSAVVFFEKALKFAEQLNHRSKIVSMEFYLAESHIKNDQLELGEYHIRNALNLMKVPYSSTIVICFKILYTFNRMFRRIRRL